jgi:hypothetical protein
MTDVVKEEATVAKEVRFDAKRDCKNVGYCIVQNEMRSPPLFHLCGRSAFHP